MRSYLETLRNKSDAEKRRIVKMSALIGTGIILVLYIVIRIVVASFDAAHRQALIPTEETSRSEVQFLDTLQSLFEPGMMEMDQQVSGLQTANDDWMRTFEEELLLMSDTQEPSSEENNDSE